MAGPGRDGATAPDDGGPGDAPARSAGRGGDAETVGERTLRLRDRELVLHPGRPALMGIVNCSPNSFSDVARPGDAGERVALAHELLEAGADLVDVGGESGVTYDAVVDAREEIARVLPVVRRLVDDGALVSVDTWKPVVAEAVLDAGAHLVNDVSAVHVPDLLAVTARHDAGIVLMHTRAAPKVDAFPDYGGDVVGDVRRLLATLRDRAVEAGVDPASIVLDPGPDFTKLPHETVEVLRDLPALAALGHPLLLAVSRKYFHGVITGREPQERLPGTLAALATCGDLAGASIARVHDVRACREHLDVRAALRGEAAVPLPDVADERLRWIRRPG